MASFEDADFTVTLSIDGRPPKRGTYRTGTATSIVSDGVSRIARFSPVNSNPSHLPSRTRNRPNLLNLRCHKIDTLTFFKKVVDFRLTLVQTPYGCEKVFGFVL